ncbi:hypothetical protein TgHK011_006220 [Trichoderma gracile]|nr:hypothetical protein TgHK011_006220 [Trichoderma gracile]
MPAGGPCAGLHALSVFRSPPRDSSRGQSRPPSLDVTSSPDAAIAHRPARHKTASAARHMNQIARAAATGPPEAPPVLVVRARRLDLVSSPCARP